jgi:hypothetical protein
MGECGCCDPTWLYQFPGPDGVVYLLDIHSGCSYCHTPASVNIYRLGREAQEDYLGDQSGSQSPPELEFYDIGDFDIASIPVLDPDILERIAVGRVDDPNEKVLVKVVLEDIHTDVVDATVSSWMARE